MKSVTGRVIVGVFVALAVFTVAGVLAIRFFGPDGRGPIPIAVDNAVVASSPFTRFREIKLKLNDKCDRVLVASNETQRVQGLRGVTSLDPYAGMLFAFEDDTTARFTMADTDIALEIALYDRNGKPVGTASMVPCPGTDLTCPTYGVDVPYRFALETPAGKRPIGALVTCS